MKAKKGYVLTGVLTQPGLSLDFVLRDNGEWGLGYPKVFTSRPEAARQMKLRLKRYAGGITMKVMSYRDWEKLVIESEISR